MSPTVIDFLCRGLTGRGGWELLAVLRVATQRIIFAATLYLHRSPAQDWIERHLTLPVEHRARLSALLEARSHPAAERRHQRRQRCHEAQASGSAALPAHAARLKDYPPGTA
ncbi:hypothetical protein ARC78_05125 [Stenotrophomonas pictorum JCM 9942]|uniref:Uncharacterized protein n=1 Tax=Stenotrophomonas pictorum JCM 9942 TaxID=1236960 RepID=A0A0R0AVW9_9GAMM|nr:hypothetical protein ARC78_05125 [Stenotrophomonas pictorum JCM 9942]